MAQLGGIVMMDPENKEAQKNFFFGGIDACKFRRPVVPGDTLVGAVAPYMRCPCSISGGGLCGWLKACRHACR